MEKELLRLIKFYKEQSEILIKEAERERLDYPQGLKSGYAGCYELVAEQLERVLRDESN